MDFDYSFVPNCSRGSNCKFLEKKSQVALLIIRQRPRNTPPYLENIDNFTLGAFYLTPLQLETKEYSSPYTFALKYLFSKHISVEVFSSSTFSIFIYLFIF